ncbi:hypothetical protein MA16_Dca008924 [Dendrobium catenatum]|uniref:Uncharacterized protein n=1 Tax=Dendrobium catenatum TaxID=906689 RepID=A0A2I0WRJ8_9ASPA|nr:hypothetical protein MA16_Dca008924 [Dendrobium catenatum]
MEKLKSLAGQTEFEETPPDHEEQRFMHDKEEATTSTSVSKTCNSPGIACEIPHDESISDVNLYCLKSLRENWI